MSGIALKWAWTQELPRLPKLVLVALAYHADEDGLAWPSNRTLRKKTGLSRTGVLAQVRKLEKSGVIVRQVSYKESGAQTSNRYQLGVHATETPPLHTIETPPIHQLREGEGPPTDGHHEIQYEIQYEIQSTGDESQDIPVKKLEDVLIEHEILSRENIFRNAGRKSDKLTPDGCSYLWTHCRESASPDNGIQLTVNIGQRQALHAAYKRIGEDFNLAVWAVMTDWIDFTHAAADTEGAFNLPQQPVISFFVKYIETAASFLHRNSFSQDSGFLQVTAKPPKALTKPNENKDNEHTAITSEELAAIGGEIE